MSDERKRNTDPYPINILKAAYEDEFQDAFPNEMVSEDQELALSYVLLRLDTKSRDVIRNYYEEHKTLAQIAEAYAVTVPWIKDLKDMALRLMRKDPYKKFIFYGIENYLQRIKDRTDRYTYNDGYEKGVREGYQRGYADRNGEYKAKEEERRVRIEQYADVSIDELNLSSRAYKCLVRAGMKTVGDIVALSREEMLKIRNLGITSYGEIYFKLRLLGLEDDELSRIKDMYLVADFVTRTLNNK